MANLRFTPQVWLIIAVAGYVIPTALGYFFVLQPLFGESEEALRERFATDEYLVLKGTANELTEFKERLSARNNVRRFQASFDSLVAASGVSLISVRADTTVEQLKAGFVFRTFNFAIEGFYPQLVNFIVGIERPNEYYVITDLAIMRTDSKTGRAQAQMKLLALTLPDR